MFSVEKKNRFILLAAATIAIGVSVGFYNYNTYANEQDYQAQVTRERKEADLLFVETLTLKTSKHDTITSQELETLTRSNRIGTMTDLEADNVTDLYGMVPGTYTIKLTIQMPSDVVIHRSATVAVIDDVAPEITVAKNINVAYGETFPREQVKVTDDTSDSKLIADHIQIKGYDREKSGQQVVTIEVQDQSGNQAKQQVTVNVAEKIQQVNVSEVKKETKVEDSAEVESSSEVVASEKTAVSQQEDAGEASASVQPESSQEKIVIQDSEKGTDQVSTSQSQETVPAAATNEDSVTESSTETDSAAPSDQAVEPQKNIQEPVIATSSLQFVGVSVPFIQAQGVSAAPESGAGAWIGNGSTTDGAPTHFIGHNPGDFSAVMSLGVGAVITVTDGNGNARSYTVYEVIDVTDDGYNNNDLTDDVYPRMLDAGGERISLQTCITDTVNQCVLAR